MESGFPFPQQAISPANSGRPSRSTRSTASAGGVGAGRGGGGRAGSARSQSETSSVASPPNDAAGSNTSHIDTAGGSSSLPADPKARRRERNRLAASAFRTRKKERFEVLESRLSGLEEENRNLKAEVQRLRSQLAATGNAPSSWVPGAVASTLGGVGSNATIGSLLSNVNLAQLAAAGSSLMQPSTSQYTQPRPATTSSIPNPSNNPQIQVQPSDSPVELPPIDSSKHTRSKSADQPSSLQQIPVTLPSFTSPNVPQDLKTEEVPYSFNEIDFDDGGPSSSSTSQQYNNLSHLNSKPSAPSRRGMSGYNTGFAASREYHNGMSGKENERGFMDDVTAFNGNGKHHLSPGAGGSSFSAKRAKMSPHLALPPLSMPLTSPHLSPHLPLTTAASLLLGNRTPTPTASYLHTLQNHLTNSGGKMTSSVRDGGSLSSIGNGSSGGGYFGLGRSERGYSERSGAGDDEDGLGEDDEL